MVLYIDFEWETEPLKMALSKNFTLPEKCKNHQRAPTVQCWSDSFFESKLFGSSLISQRNWRGPLLAPPFSRPLAGTRSETPRQFLRWTFKFTSNEEEKKAKTKEETYRMKKSRCHFFSKKNKNLSLLIIYVFFCCFSYECSLCLFHIESFFFICLHTPSLIASFRPPTRPKKNPPGENRSQWGHMHKKDKNKKLENVSRWQWRRTSYDQVSWKKTSEKN